MPLSTQHTNDDDDEEYDESWSWLATFPDEQPEFPDPHPKPVRSTYSYLNPPPLEPVEPPQPKPDFHNPPEHAVNGDDEAIAWYHEVYVDSDLGDMMDNPEWHKMYDRYCAAIGRPPREEIEPFVWPEDAALTQKDEPPLPDDPTTYDPTDLYQKYWYSRVNR